MTNGAEDFLVVLGAVVAHERERLVQLTVVALYFCGSLTDSALYCSRAACISKPTALQSDLIATQFATVGLIDLLNSRNESDQSIMLANPARKEGRANKKSDII